MKNISVYVDINDIIDEIDTETLKKELEKRRVKYIDIDDDEFQFFKTKDELLKHIRKVLGLKEWHDKSRIIKEIEDLF